MAACLACKGGFEPNDQHTACVSCAVGYYRSFYEKRCASACAWLCLPWQPAWVGARGMLLTIQVSAHLIVPLSRHLLQCVVRCLRCRL